MVPRTPDKVAAMLAAGRREPDEVLGSVSAPRRKAELAAINAVNPIATAVDWAGSGSGQIRVRP